MRGGSTNYFVFPGDSGADTNLYDPYTRIVVD